MIVGASTTLIAEEGMLSAVTSAAGMAACVLTACEAAVEVDEPWLITVTSASIVGGEGDAVTLLTGTPRVEATLVTLTTGAVTAAVEEVSSACVAMNDGLCCSCSCRRRETSCSTMQSAFDPQISDWRALFISLTVTIGGITVEIAVFTLSSTVTVGTELALSD